MVSAISASVGVAAATVDAATGGAAEEDAQLYRQQAEALAATAAAHL